MIISRIKKVISIMLTLAMCFTYLPVGYDVVHAEEETQDEGNNVIEGTTYTYIPDLPDGTNSQRLSGSKCYLDDTRYFWVNADKSSEMDAVDIIKKDREYNFYMEDGTIGYYPYMLKVGSKMTDGRLNFTVSEGKYCKLVSYLYVQNGTYIGYAVYRASDDSLVEGSERYVYDDDWKYNAVYNLEPGDYYIAKNGDYDASLNFFRIDAVETDKPVEVNTERKDWNDVQKPQITDCYSYDDYIYVRYDMPMGTDGADYIEATLIDSDGNEYMTRRSAMPAYRRLLSFVVNRSDEYTCTIKAVRYTGEEKEGDSLVYNYSYPLAQPKPFIAYNIGDGVVKIEYSEVKEAYSYTVEYKGTSDSEWSIGAVSNSGEAVVYGLDVGKEYEFRIIAHRKGKSSSSSSRYENIKITVSDEAGAGWVRESLAGNYATPNYSYVDGDLNKDNTVTLYSEAGKIARNGADGIVSTYTKIKASSNFSISAHINVLYWSNKSDQNGFGIYVSDQNYELTKGWNNALQLGAMRVTNATEQEPAFDYRMGIGYTYKYGCDPDDLSALMNDTAIDSKINLSTLGMYKEQKVLEERDQYKNCNYVIGNVNESSIGAGYTKGDITEFDIKLQKTGNVYTMTYTSADGTYSNTKSVDVGNAFTALDKDYIYVGLFAGRKSTHVRFSDVKFEINDDADYSRVDEAIKKAECLDRIQYDGFDQVDEIIKSIERGLKSDCQGKVLIMAKKLNDAINSLRLKEKVIDGEDGTKTTINSTDTIKGGEKIEVTGNKEESYVSIKSEPGENAVESEIKAGSEQELIDSVLTDDEKSQVENGESVSISLKVENSSVSKEETKKIEKEIKKTESDSNKKIGAFLDISIEKTVGKKLLGTRELNSEIELSIDVPTSLADNIKEDGKTYKVARNHEGIVDLIDAVYNASTNKLTFKTDRFSTYALLYEPVETPVFMSNSLTLGDEIGVNFYVEVPDSIKEGSSMTFNVSGIDGKTETVNIADAILADESQHKYKFTVGVNAIQMADTITAIFNYNGTDTIVQEYSVKDYVEIAMKKLTDEDAKNLIEKMADYGYYSQKCFSELRGWQFGVDHKEMIHFSDSIDTDRDVSMYASRQEGSINGITRISQSLRLDAKTEIVNRIYVDSTYIGIPTVKVTDTYGNNVVVDVVKDDLALLKSGEVAAYKIIIRGINAHMLGNEYKVTIDENLDIYESVNSYINQVLTNSQVSDNLKDACVALLDYYEAAKVYKNK